MPINQLTEFCHSSIAKNGKCEGCGYTCDNCCNRCLEKIHFENPDSRCYDCQNMVYCYTCSYIYKYASKIHYLFNKHPLTSFPKFNILILQYILNELIKNNGATKMNKFVEDLVAKIIAKMPDNSVIIINDINHYSVRNWFGKLHSEIIKYKYASFLAYRFTNPIEVLLILGITSHTNDTLLFSVPTNISTNYAVKQPCSSAQAIITIKNEI